MVMDKRVRPSLAELIGTFAIVFFGAGPVGSVPLLRGIAIEMVFGFLYTRAIFGTIIDRRAPRLDGLGPGLMQAVIVLTGFYLTGGSANPARWFGTVIWEYTSITLRDRAFTDHPVYWMGPIAGALFASSIYVQLIPPG